MMCCLKDPVEPNRRGVIWGETEMTNLKSHQRGLLMTLVGVLVLTPDALLIRLAETDHWTIMFWRSFYSAILMFGLSSIIARKSPVKLVKDLWQNGMLCAVLFVFSNACFILSVTHTSVANTLVILASMPFIAAVLGVVLMRKNLPLRTWLTIVIAMSGIVIVFWGRFGGGNLFGDLMGLGGAFFMASTLVAVSYNPKINSLAAIAAGAAMACLFALAMGAEPLSATKLDHFVLFLDGGVILPIAFGLITYGPKLISAAEVSLIMLLETVLGPVWVWWLLGETPPTQTFFGGLLVIGAVLINAALGFRSSSSAPASEAARKPG